MDPLVRALVEPAVAELLAWELWRRATATEVSSPEPAPSPELTSGPDSRDITGQ